MMTTGKLARAAGVNIETVRYYERRGLIPEPKRTESGYRLYTDETVRRIMFIKHAQDLGFSLNEISGLLSLRADSRTTCADVKKQAEDKIDDIERKIKSLQKMRKALTRLAGECSGKGPLTECPILEALEK